MIGVLSLKTVLIIKLERLILPILIINLQQLFRMEKADAVWKAMER